MIDLVVVLVLLAACAAGGLWLQQIARALPIHPSERLLEATAIGLGLASIVALALADTGLLGRWPLVATGLLALVGGGRMLRNTVSASRLPRGRTAWLLIALCGLVLLAESPTWFAPPVGGDQTKYHLVYPRLYAEAGSFVSTPWCIWSAQQWVQNFLFAIAYTLRGEDLARLLNAVSGVLAALSIASLVRRHFDRRLGVVAGTLFFTMPRWWSKRVRAGPDACLVAYAVLAVAAWLDWVYRQRPDDLRRTALLVGLAGGSKMMGLLVPALVGIGVLVVLVRRRVAPSRFLRASLTYGLLALVVLSPWYVHNWIETGSPLLPFGQRVFAGRNWSVEAEDYLNVYYDQYRTREAAQRGGTPYRGIDVVRFPWDFTMHPESFEKGQRQGYDISPFVLAFLPGLVLVRRRRTAALAVGALAGAYVMVIAAGAWAHPRYVLPGVALAFAAAAPAARAVAGRHRFGAVMALTIAGNLALISRMLKPMWPDQVRVALGRMSPDAFLAKHSERYVFWREANEAIPPAGTVAVLEKIIHPYYIERRFVLLSYLEQGLVDYRRVNTPQALEEAIGRLGVTHVAVHEAGAQAADDPFEAQVTALWRAYLGRLGEPALRAGGYALYRLDRESPRG